LRWMAEGPKVDDINCSFPCRVRPVIGNSEFEPAAREKSIGRIVVLDFLHFGD